MMAADRKPVRAHGRTIVAKNKLAFAWTARRPSLVSKSHVRLYLRLFSVLLRGLPFAKAPHEGLRAEGPASSREEDLR
jgi:hypothetical protein